MLLAADASQFTSTPSGYVITALLAVIIAGGGWWMKSQTNDLKELRRESGTHSQALAVMVARVDPKLLGIDDLTERVSGLERDFLLFAEWRRHHERWAQEERDRLLSALTGTAAPPAAIESVRH